MNSLPDGLWPNELYYSNRAHLALFARIQKIIFAAP